MDAKDAYVELVTDNGIETSITPRQREALGDAIYYCPECGCWHVTADLEEDYELMRGPFALLAAAASREP